MYTLVYIEIYNNNINDDAAQLITDMLCCQSHLVNCFGCNASLHIVPIVIWFRFFFLFDYTSLSLSSSSSSFSSVLTFAFFLFICYYIFSFEIHLCVCVCVYGCWLIKYQTNWMKTFT